MHVYGIALVLNDCEQVTLGRKSVQRVARDTPRRVGDTARPFGICRGFHLSPSKQGDSCNTVNTGGVLDKEET